MAKSFVISFLCCIVYLISASPLNNNNGNYEMFDGHIVLRAYPMTEKQLEALHFIENTGIQVDFWLEPRRVGHPVEMRVAPEHQNAVLEHLQKFDIQADMKIENLRHLIEKEQAELKNRKRFNKGDHPSMIVTSQYHSYNEIMDYLDSVATTYPSIASVVPIGSSFENRNQTAIKLGGPSKDWPKPAVWIDGGIHAREWITPATIIYIIDQLTRNMNDYSDILTAVDLYLIPSVNPDGYDYTWNTNRMWRKTRSGPISGCYGADPNRNWDYKWMVAGASSNPCSEIFGGSSAASEIEIQNIQYFLSMNMDSIKAYFNLHSYSEDWMYPYGWAEHTYPDNVNQIRALSSQAVGAIQEVNGERFSYGSITDIVYPASGSSIDFTTAALGIKYSFGMELRPSKYSWDGFQLPASQIEAGASEAWAGIQVVVNQVISEAISAKNAA